MPFVLIANTGFLKKIRRFCILLITIFVLSSVIFITKASAAVAVENVSKSGIVNSASVTWSHTVSGSNRLLVVGIGLRNYTTITSVTYGGIALTKAAAVGSGTNNYARSELWYLVNPTVGTANIVVTNSATEWMATGAITFTGVNQSTPFRASSNDTNFSTSTTTTSLTVTPSAVGDLVVENVAYWNTVWATNDPGQTFILQSNDTGNWKSGMSVKASTTTSTTMSWNIGSNVAGWAEAGFSIVPVADTTPPTTTVTIANSLYSPSTFTPHTDIINGTAADAVGVTSVQITIQRNSNSQYWTGSTWSATQTWLPVTTGTTTWKYTIDDVNFDNGITYTVNARASDAAGNTTSTGFGTDSFTYDSQIPSGGSFTINGGLLYTVSTNATLNITCPTDSWATVQMAYGTSANPSNWTTCSSSASVTLASGNGLKTVYVAFKDGGGNTTTDYTQTITLDTTPPSGPSSITVNSGNHFINGSFNLILNGTISDTGGSGLVSPNAYRICRSADGGTGCSVWLAGYFSSTANISGSDLPSEGNTRYYYGYTVDNAGNYSTASTGDYVTFDGIEPTTEVSIANAVYSPSTWANDDVINGTASDSTGSGLNTVELTIRRGDTLEYWTGSEWSLTQTWLPVTSGTSAWKYTMDDTEFNNDITYTISARGTDLAGNSTSSGFGSDSFKYISMASAPANSFELKTPISSPGKITTPTITLGGVTSGDTVKLFSDECSTQVGSAIAAGTSVDIILTNPLSEGTYTFKSQSTDPYGNNSSCSSESLTYILDTTNPSSVSSGQYKSDETTAIPQGTSTLVGENTIVLKANLADTINNNLYAQFEVKKVGIAFNGTTNLYTGNTVNYQGSQVVSKVVLTDLTIKESYQWRYRVIDEAGNISDWISFGTNNDGESDFIVAAIASVVLPSGVQTYDSNFQNTVVTNLAGILTLGITNQESGAPIALVNVDMGLVEGDLVWSDLTAETSGEKSVLHYPGGFSNLPGESGGSFSLFIPKGAGDGVLVCPGASTLGQVIVGCLNGYFLSESAPNVSVVNINGINYWKVSGLTGTGAMSIVTNFSDKSMSRLQVSEFSDHYLEFTTNNGLLLSTDSLIVTFPSEFDFGSISYTDIDLLSMDSQLDLTTTPNTNTWGVTVNGTNNTILFTPPTNGTGYIPAGATIKIRIGLNSSHQVTGINQIKNPSLVDSYQITMQINNTEGTENGELTVPIVDSDNIDITGYVTAYIQFDIDTASGEVPGVDPIIDCTFDSCLTHQNGDPGSNYTVDLGELTSAVVNKSNGTSVAHSTGGSGIINSIYFDISTNAPAGAVVSVKSTNGGLQGPGTNKIPSIGVSVGADGITRSDGQDIPANSGVYGYNLPIASSLILGSIIPNSLCDSDIEFCGPNLTPKTVFTTNNLPVDTARVRMDLAAAANYTNNPGLYTDTLTFTATATF